MNADVLDTASEVALSISTLEVAIGATHVLHDVTLAVPRGALCGLIGRNGAGKTTLLRTVMGLVPARAGTIRCDGTNLLGQPAHRRIRLGIGYMPEDRRLVPQFTAEDNLLLPLWVTGHAPAERLSRIYDLMPEVAAFARRPAGQLSGGQQKLLALARALLCGSRLVLLDEPTEGLAPALSRRLVAVLARLKGSGLSILMAESNDVLIADLLDHTFVIERGSVTRRTGAIDPEKPEVPMPTQNDGRRL
jgi:branched-chain amino acid transport system ATP-binding protein